MKRWIAVAALLFAPSLSWAHDIIVKRNSNFRVEPTTASHIIIRLEPGDELELLNVKPENGYYRGLHKEGIGWVWGQNVIFMPEYDRGDWKHWIDEEKDCQKTRAEVLIAESIEQVELSPDGCKVVSGKWLDPYTGETFTDPKKLDVDHMVPLKNAHRSGGWEWTYERRTFYANDLNHSESLIAVKASANRSKGAKGPDQWKPSNTDYWCTYATDWEAIKNRWGLSMTDAEKQAVQEMKDSCH